MNVQRLLSVEEICRKLKPLFGNKIDEIYFRYSVAETSEEKSEIIQVLNGLYQKHLSHLLDKSILLEPPQKEIISGDYFLGNVSYANKQLFPFALRENDWSRHVCVSGMSGSGKTTFALNILSNFIEKDKPFLVFDWKKSFRPLISKDPDLMCFTVGNDAVSNSFKVNINIPPKGISPKEWINVLCDLLTESFNASFGVHKILLETLDEVFEGWDIYKGSKHYPNWQHVKKMLEIKSREAKGRESGWYESALRIATVLTFGQFGKVINYEGKHAVSIEDLFDKKVILELNSLGNIEKKFFCEYLLTYIYKLKKSEENAAVRKFNYAILVDEAHNIFLKKPTNFMAESVTDMIYREMREYGISLICIDQHISKLSDTVKGNSACHIAFQQQLPEDISDIGGLVQLSEKKEIFSQLPVGTAIVKLSERYTFPFLIEVPYADLRKNVVSDDKIKEKMSCLVEVCDIEKNDSEFKEKLMQNYSLPVENDKNAKEEILPEISKEKQEQEEIILKEKEPLSKKDVILLEFIEKLLNQGKSLMYIEHLLEKGIFEGYYNEADIFKVINYILNVKTSNEKFAEKENPKTQEIQILPEGLSLEEMNFLNYLIQNPNQRLSTVELYSKVNLSTRKGNIVKNKLLEKNLIRIKEEKNLKGWKKIIYPSQTLTNNIQ